MKAKKVKIELKSPEKAAITKSLREAAMLAEDARDRVVERARRHRAALDGAREPRPAAP